MAQVTKSVTLDSEQVQRARDALRQIGFRSEIVSTQQGTSTISVSVEEPFSFIEDPSRVTPRRGRETAKIRNVLRFWWQARGQSDGSSLVIWSGDVLSFGCGDVIAQAERLGTPIQSDHVAHRVSATLRRMAQDGWPVRHLDYGRYELYGSV